MNMKRFQSLLIVLILLTALVPSTVSATTGSDVTVVDLIAGQHFDAGDIKVWNDSDYLYVKYKTSNYWCLDETHLQVASSLDDIPQTNGNPIPGQFEYQNTHNCVSKFTYTIPLTKNTCDLYIAAHAVVEKSKFRHKYTETAWGGGLDFPGNDWATYFIYSVHNCRMTPTSTATPTQPTQETFTPTSTASSTATFTPTVTNTPTPTATSTPTSTATSTVCQPNFIVADFSQVAVGESVEGLGAVAPYLDIDAKGTAVKILDGTSPKGYGAPNDNVILNGGIAAGGGFSDVTSATASQAHQYTFTFAGITISDFSLHMLDYGDWNPPRDTNHSVSLTAYDSNGTAVLQQEISYTTQAVTLPRDSSLYGDLYITGDAETASPGQLGNWTWNVFGSGIAKIALDFGSGFDPNIGFDTLNFTTNCP